MEYTGQLITEVTAGSIADELDIKPGDRLMTIDGHNIEDVLDYRFYINSESMTMVIIKADGEEWELEIEHDYEDPGLVFDSGLMSDYKSCSNKCVFCFIDQMPKGMRETLYFKDDDSRLSFLQGNYVTLTNMKHKDIERIIDMKLSPINISIHTTNKELRCKMLGNRFAGESLKYLDILYDKHIPMNGQIVLCPDWNDKKELVSTLTDLLKYGPYMESISIVPIGLSKYRDGLEPMRLFTKEEAAETIDIIEEFQKQAKKAYGVNMMHASDEFYLLAGRDLPEESRYDGYIQLENGVGMLRLLEEEVKDALADEKLTKDHETITIATGKLAATHLDKLLKDIQKICPNKNLKLVPIRNDYFGETITVSGLVTGIDIINQLRGTDIGDRLLLPINMFRSGEEVFLDDITKTDVEKELKVPVTIVAQSGYDLVHAICDSSYSADTTYNHYEA